MDNYSVLMAIYEKDKPFYIKESIDSMLRQTHLTNDFVLVCDGDVSNEQEELIDFYLRKNEFFHVVRLPNNLGLGEALNIGLTHCINEFVARMDSDDISFPERCKKQVDFMSKFPEISVLGCPVVEFEKMPENAIRIKKVPATHEEIVRYSKIRNPFNHPSVMIRRSHVMQVGNYSNMRTNQDVELWVRMLHNGYKGHNLQEPLLYFRFDQNTYQRRKKWQNVKLLISVWKGFFKKKYCSLADFLIVLISQVTLFILPIWAIKWVYAKIR